MTDTTEAEAREAEALSLLGLKTNRVLRTGNEEGWNDYLVEYAEAVRRTERLKAEALVTGLEAIRDAHGVYAEGGAESMAVRALAAYQEGEPR